MREQQGSERGVRGTECRVTVVRVGRSSACLFLSSSCACALRHASIVPSSSLFPFARCAAWRLLPAALRRCGGGCCAMQRCDGWCACVPLTSDHIVVDNHDEAEREEKKGRRLCAKKQAQQKSLGVEKRLDTNTDGVSRKNDHHTIKSPQSIG